MIPEFRLLLVDPDAAQRTRLKQVLASIVPSKNVDWVRHLSEAQARLTGEQFYDALVVSSRYTPEQISELVTNARSRPEDKRCLILVNLAAGHAGGIATSATLYCTTDIDGFLAEPYVAANIETLLTSQAAPRSSDTGEKRSAAALQLLVADAMINLDETAETMARGEGNGYGYRNLHQIKNQLGEIGSQLKAEQLEEILISRFAKAQPSRCSRNSDHARSNQPVMHPGAALKLIMAERKISADKLCAALNLEKAVLDAFLDSKYVLDADLARSLSRVVGNSQSYWLELQKKWSAMQPPTAAAVPQPE